MQIQQVTSRNFIQKINGFNWQRKKIQESIELVQNEYISLYIFSQLPM